MNNIQAGQPLPENWTEGGIIHIHKKRSKNLCTNYRPICLTQVIYKVWSRLLTNRLAKTLHLMTSNNQYGYKGGVSTIDAIMKIEQAIRSGPKDTKIILMGITKAFGSVSRTMLWTSLSIN